MAQIIDNRTNIDQTIQIFDSFYSFNTVVNPTEYDIVHGYFTGVCSSKQVAENFTALFFRIAQATALPVLTLLGYIQGNNQNDKLNMNKTLCYFLNSLKSKTALYGVAQVPKPNIPVARNILQ
jgi:thioester reductase-like protein